VDAGLQSDVGDGRLPIAPFDDQLMRGIEDALPASVEVSAMVSTSWRRRSTGDAERYPGPRSAVARPRATALGRADQPLDQSNS
jgi:hypothetical protein